MAISLRTKLFHFRKKGRSLYFMLEYSQVRIFMPFPGPDPQTAEISDERIGINEPLEYFDLFLQMNEYIRNLNSSLSKRG